MGCFSSKNDNETSEPSPSEAPSDTSQPKTAVNASGRPSSDGTSNPLQPKRSGVASAESGSSTFDDPSILAQVKGTPGPERAPDHELIRNKIAEGIEFCTGERKYAFAIGGQNVDRMKILGDEVGIFGIITFSDANSDRLKMLVKGAFAGLLKYELMKGKDYASVFSNVQVMLSEQVRTTHEDVGQITATFVVCGDGELLIFSPDAQTQMKIVSEEQKSGIVQVAVRDVLGDVNDEHCYLGSSPGEHNRPLEEFFESPRSDSFLIISSGLDGIKDSLLKELFSVGQEHKIQNLADSIYSIGTGSQKEVIVVDLRQTD